MNEEKVKQFEQFFIKEYKYLRGFTKSINPSHPYEDTVHDTFIKCRDRIQTNGYEGTDYLNFTRVSIINNYKSQYRNNKKKQLVDLEDPDYYNKIEDILSQQESQEEQSEEQNQKDTYVVTMVYEYIDKYHTPKDRFVFSSYYLLHHKHLNYKQLAEVTNMSITSVSNTIKRMKKAIRRDIKCYILNSCTMNELLEEVRLLLEKPIGQNFHQYRNIYKKVFNKEAPTCKCHSNQMYSELQEWYMKNKN